MGCVQCTWIIEIHLGFFDWKTAVNPCINLDTMGKGEV